MRCLTSAVNYFSRVENHSRLAEVYLERGLLSRRLGREDAAKGDFVAGVTELEAERAGIAEDSFRLSYFEGGKNLFEELIGLLAKQGDTIGALDYPERSKSGALLDEATTGASGGIVQSPLGAREIAQRLLESVALIEYRVLPQGLLAWVIQSGIVKMIQVPVTAADLASRVEKLRQTIESDAATPKDPFPGAALYELLIQPLEAELRAGTTLVIVPDKSLYDVPFAALQDPRSGRYLIQDRAIATTPSGSFLIRNLEGQGTSSSVPRSALVVDNPSFDRATYPLLRPLAFADEEAAQIASAYPVVEIQKAEAATKRRVLGRAPAFEVLHFAGHAVVNEQKPAYSMLLLSPDASTHDSGLLYAHEIASADLARTRLVVLGACETSRGQVKDVEGALTLARAFLEAGSPAVLATLWKAEDRATAMFLSEFHRRLAAGGSAVASLRSAQIQMMQETDRTLRRPTAWAPFVLFGKL